MFTAEFGFQDIFTSFQGVMNVPFSFFDYLTQNWIWHGESDCLIKTKYCELLRSYLYNVPSAQCSECHSDAHGWINEIHTVPN